MAPGVTTMAMTRQAPTVCSAATVQAESSVKNRIFSSAGVEADGAGMALVEEGDHQVLPLQSRIGERDRGDDRDLDHVLVGDGEDVAEHDGLDVDRGRPDRRPSSRPSANSAVKTRPITASSRSRECCLTKCMPPAARRPAKNAPTAKGAPRM